MPTVTLRPSHKAVLAYYESLAAFRSLGEEHEQAVRSAFATLLETAAKPFGWKLVPEHSMRVKGGKRIAPDGTLMDLYRLHHGHWEAKDTRDDLEKEIRAKIARGYPTDNLLFWEPRRAVLYQHGHRIAETGLDELAPSGAKLGRWAWSARAQARLLGNKVAQALGFSNLALLIGYLHELPPPYEANHHLRQINFADTRSMGASYAPPLLLAEHSSNFVRGDSRRPEKIRR